MTLIPQAFAARVLSALVLVAAASSAFAQKAIVVVRHAEKADQSTDPVLSGEGVARAHALAKVLRTLEVKEVYVTQYQRTPLTAAPLMAANNLKPVVIQADATARPTHRPTDTRTSTGASAAGAPVAAAMRARASRARTSTGRSFACRASARIAARRPAAPGT